MERDHSDDTKQQISNIRKGKYAGKDNPRYGKEHWCKGKRLSNETKAKIREAALKREQLKREKLNAR